MTTKEFFFATTFYKGYSLLHLAVEFMQLSNDDFFTKYGFNFNPHEWSGLYEIAREKVFGIE